MICLGSAHGQPGRSCTHSFKVNLGKKDLVHLVIMISLCSHFEFDYISLIKHRPQANTGSPARNATRNWIATSRLNSNLMSINTNEVWRRGKKWIENLAHRVNPYARRPMSAPAKVSNCKNPLLIVRVRFCLFHELHTVDILNYTCSAETTLAPSSLFLNLEICIEKNRGYIDIRVTKQPIYIIAN